MMQIAHDFTIEVRIILLLHCYIDLTVAGFMMALKKIRLCFFILNVFCGFGKTCFGDLWIKYVLEKDTSSI